MSAGSVEAAAFAPGSNQSYLVDAEQMALMKNHHNRQNMRAGNCQDSCCPIHYKRQKYLIDDFYTSAIIVPNVLLRHNLYVDIVVVL